MSLLIKIKTDLNSALKESDQLKLGTLRFLLADLQNRQMEKQAELTDEEVIQTIRSQVKKRKESIVAYREGARNDLADKEEQELAILSKYLPQQMEAADLEKIVAETISQSGAAGPQDFGRVMGMVMVKTKGQADGAAVAALVKKSLS